MVLSINEISSQGGMQEHPSPPLPIDGPAENISCSSKFLVAWV